MQHICEFSGGVKEYLEANQPLVTPAVYTCTICKTPHRLRLNGSYCRWCITLAYPSGKRIRIQRLRCMRTGRTISLLPDFCHPRRQYGPDIIGVFLISLFLKGQTLLGALRSAHPPATHHTVAQSLRDGFKRQRRNLSAYVASIHPSKIEVPERIDRDQRPYARLVLGLTGRSRNPGGRFVYHGRCIHARFGQGLLAGADAARAG